MNSKHHHPTTGRRLGAAAVAVALMVSVGAMTMPGVADARGFVRGDFTVAVDLPTASLEDVGASACKLTVDATVTFTGDVVGAADGTTVALIGAACSEMATTPPGTFADAFGFVGEFSGTLDGQAVDATLGYVGVTRAGGAIKAEPDFEHQRRPALRGRTPADAMHARTHGSSASRRPDIPGMSRWGPHERTESGGGPRTSPSASAICVVRRSCTCWPAGEAVDEAGELGQPGDVAARTGDVGDVSDTDERHEVVLAGRGERHVADHHHLVVTCLEHGREVARRVLAEAGHASRRTSGRPAEECAAGRLASGPRRSSRGSRERRARCGGCQRCSRHHCGVSWCHDLWRWRQHGGRAAEQLTQ